MTYWVFVAILGFNSFCAAQDESVAEKFKLLGQITRFGLYGVGLVMVALAPLRQNKGAYLASLWGLWGFVQYTRWFPALNVRDSLYFREFYGQVASTLCVLGFDSPKGETITETSFGHYCATQSSFVINGLEMLFVLAFTAFLLIVAIVIGIGAEEGIRFSIKSEAKCSILIRGVTITMFDLTIFAVVQMEHASFGSGFELFNTIAAGLYLAFVAVFSVFIPVVICKNHQKVSQVCSPAYYSTLTDEFRTGLTRASYHYESLFFSHRLISALVIVLAYDYPKAQIAALCVLDFLLVGYIIAIRPYPRATLFLCSLYTHSASIGLLIVEALLYIEFISVTLLASLSVFLFWSGVLSMLIRYFGSFKGSYISSQVAHIDTLNSITDNPPSLYISTEVKSQLPNEPYLPMQRTSKTYAVPIDPRTRS